MSDQVREIKMEDMPQMPETKGFLQMFQEMVGLDLIGQEWSDSLTPAAVAAIVLGSVAVAVGAGATAAWYNYTHEEEGVVRRLLAYCNHKDSVWEQVKKAFKQD